MKFLTERRYSFTFFAKRVIDLDVKKKLFFMSLNYDTEFKSTAGSSDKNQTYEIPDKIFSLSASNVSVAPMLFQQVSWAFKSVVQKPNVLISKLLILTIRDVFHLGSNFIEKCGSVQDNQRGFL